MKSFKNIQKNQQIRLIRERNFLLVYLLEFFSISVKLFGIIVMQNTLKFFFNIDDFFRFLYRELLGILIKSKLMVGISCYTFLRRGSTRLKITWV